MARRPFLGEGKRGGRGAWGEGEDRGGNYRGVKGTKKGEGEREKKKKERKIEPKEVVFFFPALVGNACRSASEGEESGGLARFVTVRGRVAFPKARPPL